VLEREHLESKKIPKTNAVTSMPDYKIDPYPDDKMCQMVKEFIAK
jgi:hypothetical protein